MGEQKRQDEAYFVTHPPLPPNSVILKVGPCKALGWGGGDVGCWQHCPHKAPSLGRTVVNRGGRSLPQDDHDILVHSGTRCLLRVEVGAFRMRMEEQDHLLSW